ncbi:unnamed protein product, partial [Iphiclides podalirius]
MLVIPHRCPPLGQGECAAQFAEIDGTGEMDNGVVPDTTTWKINATFSLPNDDSEEEDDSNKLVAEALNDNDKKCNDNEKDTKPNSFTFPSDLTNETGFKKEKTVGDKENGITADPKKEEKDKSPHKEFKPSPHLSSYYDTLDDSPLRSFMSFSSPEKKPTLTFFEHPQDEYKQTNRPPEDFIAFPYKYEKDAHSNAGWSSYGLQSRPTDEAPVRIPAGGLYRHPSFLKEITNSYGEDEDVSPDTHDANNLKDISLKKRSNPWKSLLHLVTALLPVGLIVSALTPSIITVQNTGTEQHYKRLSRSSDMPTIPSVSEQCKRRLLCEIQSDSNYESNVNPYRRPKHCYKIRCEDPQAVSRVLNWLLTYYRSGDSRGRGYT